MAQLLMTIFNWILVITSTTGNYFSIELKCAIVSSDYVCMYELRSRKM